ncbi:MAG: hypothetical protein M1832_005304 [Thelocarpon impressellum]|nr:MAG: hypothetical protein M1832_005304 [Thelocarpon impressellum]
MAPYWPVYIARSDGKLEIELGSSKKEPNEPTEQQMDPTPDAKGVSDFYKRLISDDPKEIDWRRKLGGMVMREIGEKEHQGKNYILAALPENFRLYEHIKYTMVEDKKDGVETGKGLVKGPMERQDAYLYGHPLGRKKRYRSPADFFAHVLWLATDPDGDNGNCTCKICSPEEFQIAMPEKAKAEAAVAAVAEKAPVVVEIEASPQKTDSKGSLPPVAADVAGKASPSPAPRPRAPSVAAPPRVVTPPLPPIRSREQDLDAQPGQFVFRPGELVWFNKGPAWGLAVIVMRGWFKDAHQKDTFRYLLQPLSHPFHHPPQRVVSDEQQIRPWLAWSAPAPTHQGLISDNLTYDTIDWAGVVQGRAGPGDAEVDGSIFAAKALDESYTPFDQISVPNPVPGETHWNGVFMGGEKLWRGDPVRLKIGSGSDIMVVQEIVERTRQAVGGAAQTLTIQIVGDIYTFSTSLYNASQPKLSEAPGLPQRLSTDLQFRNAASQRVKNTASQWRLIQSRARIGLAQLRGRWYESRMLLPILKGPTEFEAELAAGEVADAGSWMNARGDAWSAAVATSGDRAGVRHDSRRAALGRAVPASITVLGSGLDGPPQDNVFPELAPEQQAASLAANDHGQHQQQQDAAAPSKLGAAGGAEDGGSVAGDLEQFMDLDTPEYESAIGGGAGAGAGQFHNAPDLSDGASGAAREGEGGGFFDVDAMQ